MILAAAVEETTPTHQSGSVGAMPAPRSSSKYVYDTERLDYSTSTPLVHVRPDAVRVLSVSSGVLKHYQNRMSKAVWRPAPGRKLGFLVMQDDDLLGLIFLASPVIRMSERDAYLFPDAGPDFNYGVALRNYMDMSVCVAAQPIGWHWNIGKLLALIAPTLGDHVGARYPDEFKGVTTTSLWGRSSQYNRVYKFLGYTKGHGHEQVSDERYEEMLAFIRERCPHCAGDTFQTCLVPGTRFGDGSNPRMRRIAAYKKLSGDKTVTLEHGKKRGIYYHPAVAPLERFSVVEGWYERWGRPRFEKTKDIEPPYADGLDGRKS